MVFEVLRRSPDPAIQRLVGVRSADITASPRVQALLNFPTVHPYKKWWGTHWRLVALADLGMTADAATLYPGIDQELSWLTSAAHRNRIQLINGLVRRCASQEGNAIYACSKLGWAHEPRVRQLVDSLLDWQWPRRRLELRLESKRKPVILPRDRDTSARTDRASARGRTPCATL